MYNEATKVWALVDKTEVIQNNLNPDFKKSFLLLFQFEKQQKLRFEMVDIDLGDKHNKLGVIETTLGKIMGSSSKSITTDLLLDGHQKPRGQFTVKADAVQESNWELKMQIGG